MEISTEQIKQLREKASAGVMDCRNALISAEGNVEKAIEILREQGFSKAQKKAERVAGQGLIESYIHTGGRVGAMVEVNCETDFVARTDVFKELAHNIAMQVAAMPAQCLDECDLPEGSDADPKEACLLLQPYIKDPGKTIRDLLTEAIAATGENMKISRFARFQLGVDS